MWKWTSKTHIPNVLLIFSTSFVHLHSWVSPFKIDLHHQAALRLRFFHSCAWWRLPGSRITTIKDFLGRMEDLRIIRQQTSVEKIQLKFWGAWMQIILNKVIQWKIEIQSIPRNLVKRTMLPRNHKLLEEVYTIWKLQTSAWFWVNGVWFSPTFKKSSLKCGDFQRILCDSIVHHTSSRFNRFNIILETRLILHLNRPSEACLFEV